MREEILQMFGNDLMHKAERQVQLKQDIEQRWIDDLRHYNGRYDRETQARLDELNRDGQKTSTIFVNLTRAKTNHGEAKLADMIFPTDDRNWGITSTPVPELVKQEHSEKPVQLMDGQQAINPDTQQPYTYADLQQANVEEAKRKAELMQTEIDDQLKESKYDTLGRDVIHDATVIGTGIFKGPMVTTHQRRSWSRVQASDGQVLYQMTLTADRRPFVATVDPWNFFPDMSATSWEECEFCFERHLMTRKQVRALAKRPGFMLDQLRETLRDEPRSNSNRLQILNEIREINGITQIQEDNRYEIWEYHGPVKQEYMLACGCDPAVEDDDPLQEIIGTVWFCGSRVLKVGINQLDDESLPYSVFNWEKDETCIFGFGIPYRARGPQRTLNGSWRMILDNGGLSTGPQVVINRKVVEPVNGKWELTPRALWWVTKEGVKAEDAFDTFNIDSNQQQLTAIFELSKQLLDDETQLPSMGQAFQEMNQPAIMKTLGGTALWLSSQNVTMRRAVKNWDDDITDTLIPRMYYWNMQFNPKDEIKGDYEVIARGSSVLMVRELQARNLVEFLNIVYSNPKFMEKVEDESLLRLIAKAMQVPEAEVFKPKGSKEAPPQGPPDPEVIKAQSQEKLAQYSLQEKQIESQALILKAQMEREVALTRISVEQQLSVDEINNKYGLEKMKSDRELEKFYQELHIKQQEGQKANYGLE